MLGAASVAGPGRLGALLAAGGVLTLVATTSPHAQNATWLTNPNSNDFETGSNWAPAVVPTGVATFATSATTAITFSAPTTIGAWTFNAGASDYTFTIPYTYPSGGFGVVTFTGAGITINGGAAQINNYGILDLDNASSAGGASIYNDGLLAFANTSTAGAANITNVNTMTFSGSSTANTATITNDYELTFENASAAGAANITSNAGAFFTFLDTSSAGGATIANNGNMAFENTSNAGTAAITNNSYLYFIDTSSAAGAIITNHGNSYFQNASVAGNASITNYGQLEFQNTSNAGAASITNASGGLIGFYDTSSAGAATIVNNGGASGVIAFYNTSTAGLASITNASGGLIGFYDTSSAGAASIVNNGGAKGGIAFLDNSTAGTSNIVNNSTLAFTDASTAGNATITNNSLFGFNDTSSAGSANIVNNYLAGFYDTSTAGNATITNNDGLSFNDASSAGAASIANSGGGLIEFNDTSSAGNATITNANNGLAAFYDASSAGAASIVNNFGVGFYNNSTAANSTIVTTDNAALAFFGNSNGGAAQLVANAGGVVDFSASTGPSGNGVITAGSIAGAGDFYLGADNLVVGGNNLATIGSGVISDCGATGAACLGPTGAGSLTKVGSGTLTLTGDNTYTGATTIDAGSTLALAGTGSTSLSSGVADNGVFTIAGLTNGGTSITSLSGAGVVTLGANTLALSNASGLFSGVIGGTGGLTMNGGAETLTGANTYSGATTINSGSTLALAGTGSISSSSNVADSGVFTIAGLTNGGTSITSLSGAGVVTLGGNTLALSNAKGLFSGAVGGTGGLTLDAGYETLTGASTYSGATAINGGTLEVDGSIATSSVTVSSGGVLTGVGVVDPVSVTIKSGAVFSPGAAGQPGTSMSIFGSLTFNAGATYEIYLNPSTSTLAKVMGAASLNGEVLANFATGAFVTKKYTILTATGGLGGTTFSSLAEINLPAGFAESLTYDANDVYFDLTSTLGAATGLNVNQRNVAAALGNAFNNGASLPPAFANVFGLSGAALPNALTQLSGEAADGARKGAFLLDDMFLTLMLDPYAENRGADLSGAGSFGAGLGYANEEPQPSAFSALAKDPASTAPGLPRWNAWGAAFGGGAWNAGVASIGSHDTSSAAGGFAAGADYHVSPDTMLGFAVAGSGAGWSLSQGLGGGQSDVFQVGVYGVHDFGPAYVAAALDASNYWTTTNRTVTLPGGGAYAANFEAQSFGGRLESGYRIPLAGFTLTPYGALQAISFHAPAYSENAAAGGPGFALNYASQSATDARFELGAWADKTFVLADGDALKLFGRAAFVHDWQNNPAVAATFQDLTTATFVVNGARPAPNQALIAVGAEWRFAKNWTLMAKFQGEFGQGSQSYNAAARLSYAW